MAPTGLTFGTAGRNILRNPSRVNFDMALLKHFAVTESKYFEFRAEAFNVFNHTQFTGVNSAFTYNAAGVNTNANIGALTGERGPRIVSLELRLMF